MALKFSAGLRSVLAFGFCLLAPALFAQTVRNVGAGQTYTTIQSGINAAVNGDTVLVAPGTYTENIDFKGKAITVTSSGGAAVTTIAGGTKAATVIFGAGETRASILSNLTVTGGQGLYYTTQGGIYISGSSPTILNNIITKATCYGINSQGSSPLIRGNEISYTLAQPYQCSFASGAGIWLFGQASGAVGQVIGNTIEYNTQSGLEDAGGNGGAGIAVWNGTPLIESNVIRYNATGKYFSPAGGGEGGGLYFASAGGTVVNNLIYGNTSNLAGGGVYIGIANPGAALKMLLLNNTIVDNAVVPVTTYSQQVVGGQQMYYQGGYNSAYVVDITFSNNVVSGSTVLPSVDCYDGTLNPVTYRNNDFYNSAGPTTGIYGSGTCTFPAGSAGNISADPAFAGAGNQEYHLLLKSPAVDAGNTSDLQLATALGFPITTDLDGTPRVQDATGKGCIVDMGAYEFAGSYSLCGTAETLTSSLNPSSYGQSVTFTAQLTSQNGVPTGSVQFSDGTTVLGTQVVNGSGAAAYATSQLAAGSHTMTAAYQPSGSFPATTASLVQVVNGYPTATALSCSPSTISVGSASLLAVSVTSANGTPTGSVAFADGGVALGTQAVAGGGATLSYTGTTAGVHAITATYAATGNFAGSAGSCTITVTALPTVSSMSVSPTLSTYGSPVTLTATVTPSTSPNVGTPTGTVTFLNGSVQIGSGTLANGIASMTISTLVPPGSTSLGCTYSGSTAYASSSCATVGATVTPAATTTSVTAAPNPAYIGQAVTLRALVTAPGVAVPVSSGNVAFFDGTTQLGTGTVSAGAASLVTSSLVVGTHAITATFNSAGGPFAGSTSTAVNEVVLPSGFTIALTPNTLTVKQGATGSVAVQLSSVGSFAGPLNLSVGAMPTNSTAVFDRGAVALTSGGTGAATLSIRTYVSPVRAAVNVTARGRVLALVSFGLLLPVGLLRRRRIAYVLCMIAAVTTVGLSGCTELYAALPAVSAGTYQLPVTATDANGVTQTVTLQLTVTPR